MGLLLGCELFPFGTRVVLAADGQSSVPNLVFVNLPVSIDGRIVGDLKVGVTGTALYSVDRKSWESLAKGYFDTDVIQRVAQSAGEGQVIPVTSFIEEFIDIFFDPSVLEIKINLADSRRQTQDLSLRRKSVDYENLSNLDLPGRSAYLNFNLQQDYLWNDTLNRDSQLSTLVNLDGAITLFGSPHLTLESGAFIDSSLGDDAAWQRRETRLVYDDLSRAVRYSLGDIFYRTTEFQMSPPLLGLSVERAYAEIQPLRNITPTGTRSFTVSQRSTVEIYVNGLYQDTLHLDPGRYDLSDFAVNSGVNEVSLLITDPSGQQRSIEFSLFTDPTLLKGGVSEFSFNAGYQRGVSEVPGIAYDFNLPAISGFYRYGITDYLTLGASVQGTELQQVAGGELSLATPFGILAADVSASELDGIGRGTAASLRWSYDFFLWGERAHELDVVAVARDELYTYMGQASPSLQNKSELRVRYSAPGPFGTFLSASARQAESFIETDPVDKAYGFNITRRFGFFNFSLRLEQDNSVTEETRALVRLSAPLGQRQLVSTRWDTFSETGDLQLDRMQRGTVGDFSGRLALRSDVDNYRADMGAFYQGNRFQLGLDHNYVQFDDVDREPDQLSTLRLGSSLVYADGTVAWGRPIEDSFIMVRRHESLGDSRILVDERQGGYIAVADSFGPAVVPAVNSYVSRRIHWEAENPPFGYDMGDIDAYSFPLYRSGMAYTAGSEASLTLIGLVQDTRGAPVTMTVGQIIATDGRDFPMVTTFTNKAGRFVAQGLAPGAYQIVFPDRGDLKIPFTIEEGASGIVELGIIKEKVSL
ncbi:fimbria/pilus outer membrane usher protein [Microbulbifer pacificus]|uniref:Fimbria/pilus outer membrane usher protein n=1 Tax=Microbulbifer pacificus TaxID=407164 RepID=A0AAU0N4A4_9GAMM|nr:fimbria/pilus outer membrane usher protein [Microbulbifer pacificus]WOX07114.1 fimbria/pilus outer membrane usher protein [Microbulbifer pacificus]